MYIRPYAKSDFEAVYALDQVCFTARFRFSRAMMRRVVQSGEAVVLLACDATEDGGDERLLGFCAAELPAGREAACAYVSTLDVAPESRGQGVAQALMTAAEAALCQAGVSCVLLHVYVENESAVRLYERLRYEQMGREADFYGKGFDAWVYLKRLSSR